MRPPSTLRHRILVGLVLAATSSLGRTCVAAEVDRSPVDLVLTPDERLLITANQTSASLSLVKSASPSSYDAVGGVVSYGYLVTNTGNVRLAGPVTVVDDKTSVTCPALSTVGNGDGFLDPGESVSCTASYVVTQADLNAGSVTNVAKASAGGVDSNEDTETVSAVQSRSLSLVKSASPSTYASVDISLRNSIAASTLSELLVTEK